MQAIQNENVLFPFRMACWSFRASLSTEKKIYLNGSQVLLLLWRRLMDKPQPVGITRVTSIQNIQNISFTATDLREKRHWISFQKGQYSLCSFVLLHQSAWLQHIST